MVMHTDTLPRLLVPVATHHPAERRIEGELRLAAVAAVFRRTGVRGLELLFIQRARQRDDPWSGQMAFPGGRMEPEDRSALATAVRETREEVGLDLERDARRVGQLDDVQAMARGRPVPLVIRPFVFLLTRSVDLVLNEEVADVVWIPLDWLQSGQGAGTMDYDWHGVQVKLPCVRYRGYLVWGLTYRMLSSLLRLLPESQVAGSGEEESS